MRVLPYWCRTDATTKALPGLPPHKNAIGGQPAATPHDGQILSYRSELPDTPMSPVVNLGTQRPRFVPAAHAPPL